MLFKKRAILFLLVFLYGTTIFAQTDTQDITGVVFWDANQNGIYEPGEKGIQGVMVSNQYDVVTTDKKGRYSTTLRPGQALMVIQPSGYAVPVNEVNIPQFSYIYEPEGSPQNLRYAGLEATGKLPKNINFPLIKSKKETHFNALIFGDPQPRDDKELDYVRDTFINQAATEDASFMLILGDIMYNDLSLFERHKKLMAKAHMPVWHVVGNHDLNFDTEGNRHARDTFKSQIGANYYAFEYGNVIFIVLDNVDYMGLGKNDRPQYKGNIWGDQLIWLKNLLKHIPENRLIVMGTHIPLYAWDGKTENVNTMNREELFKLFEKHQNMITLSGHLHMTYHHYLDQQVGWTGQEKLHHLITTTVSGTWWDGPKDENKIPITTQRDGVPNGYHRFTFSGTNYSEQLIGLGKPDDYQIQIELPEGSISSDDERPKEVVVNVLNGSEKSKVWYRLDEGEWIQMKQNTRPSPYYEYLLNEFPDNWASSLRAIPTNHIWISDFSVDNDKRVHLVEVKTIDAYGKEWWAKKVIEIEK